MTDGVQYGCCVSYRYTWRDRLWRRLGFRYHLGDDIDDAAEYHGWMQNRSRFFFTWSDRIRLLLTGRLLVVTTFHLDTPSPDKMHTRLDWEIKPPGKSFS